MKISVIIPAHNEEKVIEATLKAVSNQTYPDYEVIVVNNNCTDSTPTIVSLFPDIKLVSEHRKGTMWACERGRTEAKGEIIVRMDADCLPEPDWLAKGVIHFKDSRVVTVSGPYDYYDASALFRRLSLLTQKYLYTAVHSILGQLNKGGITIGGNTFMSASALDLAGGFATHIVFYGDDTDIPKRLSKYGTCIFDRNLIIKTSARRFKEQGTLKLMLTYWYFFFKTIFFTA